MTINERIKEIRRSSGLSQTDFAERLGTTRGVITNLEGEKTSPNEPFIKLICREFNVNEYWLRTGEGEMKQKLTRNQEIAEFMGVVMHDPADVLLVKTSRHSIRSPILPQKDRSFFVHFPGCAFFGVALQYL